MGVSTKSLKPRWRRCKWTQNAHLLSCKLRFFVHLRLAIIGLIEFVEVPK